MVFDIVGRITLPLAFAVTPPNATDEVLGVASPVAAAPDIDSLGLVGLVLTAPGILTLLDTVPFLGAGSCRSCCCCGC